MIATTMKPPAPANRNDVSTWTQEQLSYAATIIPRRIAELNRQDTETIIGTNNLVLIAGLRGLIYRRTKHLHYWLSVQAGNNPKVPVFLREQRVAGYQQTNERHRPSKTRYAGPKDWGIWN